MLPPARSALGSRRVALLTRDVPDFFQKKIRAREARQESKLHVVVVAVMEARGLPRRWNGHKTYAVVCAINNPNAATNRSRP